MSAAATPGLSQNEVWKKGKKAGKKKKTAYMQKRCSSCCFCNVVARS